MKDGFRGILCGDTRTSSNKRTRGKRNRAAFRNAVWGCHASYGEACKKTRWPIFVDGVVPRALPWASLLRAFGARQEKMTVSFFRITVGLDVALESPPRRQIGCRIFPIHNLSPNYPNYFHDLLKSGPPSPLSPSYLEFLETIQETSHRTLRFVHPRSQKIVPMNFAHNTFKIIWIRGGSAPTEV